MNTEIELKEQDLELVVSEKTLGHLVTNAKDIPEANKRMEDYLRQGFDMKLDGIVKTKILDVI